MAFDSPPYAMDGTTQDAELFRRAIGTLLSSAGGIVTPGDLTVTQQASPNMSVLIAEGEIWIPGTSTATQGLYYSRNQGSVTVPISAADPSNPRVDTVIVQVQDETYAGSIKQCVPDVVIGTPTAGIVVPPTNPTDAVAHGAGAVPVSSMVLAYVLVPQSATSIVTADIANVTARIAVPPARMTAIAASGDITAADGQLILASGVGQTVTLPPVAGSTTLAVMSVSAATAVTVVPQGGVNLNFVGQLGSGGSMVLGPGAAAIFYSDGGSWFVVSGQRDTGWNPLTLSASYAAVPTGAFAPAARVVGDELRLRGVIQDTGGGHFGLNQIATIPVGLRPAQTVMTPTMTASLTGGTTWAPLGFQAQGPLWIDTGGAVWFYGSTSIAHGITLDNLRFSLA